jgi:Phage integrase, N-terminal
VRDLNYDFKQIGRHNRDGSYATQADRQNILDLVADQLYEMGFRGLRAQGFKPKHVEKLVERWLAEQLTSGTIKNRMSHLRWLAQKIGKENIVERTNAAYGIRDRVYVTNVDKGKDLDRLQLEQIRCPYTQMSLRLEDGFGLRREASIKIVPARADQGDTLVLKASRNKGGREIRIPIRTAEQRQLLDEAKALAKGKSLVAPGYATYRTICCTFATSASESAFTACTAIAECPARGGPTSKQLTKKQKERDREAREVISHEMGHGRER